MPTSNVDPEDTFSLQHSAVPTTSTSRLTCVNYFNILAYFVNVVITYGIGVAGILDLPTNDELSAKYQTLVTPVGWTFSIWGL